MEEEAEDEVVEEHKVQYEEAENKAENEDEVQYEGRGRGCGSEWGGTQGRG